jgi:hypothetical protein
MVLVKAKSVPELKRKPAHNEFRLAVCLPDATHPTPHHFRYVVKRHSKAIRFAT